MKITKTSWIFITAGVLLLGGMLLGNQFNQQNQQKTALESQVALAKKKLAAFDNDQLIAQKASLAASIQTYTQQISTDKINLTNALDNIDITNMLIADAGTYGVDILVINSQGTSEETLAGTLCQIQLFNIKTLGTIDNTANFVYSLKKLFPTSAIKSVDLGLADPPPVLAPDASATPTPSPDPTSTPKAAPAPFKDTTATTNLVIYSYKGN